jgi:hypothetical protein
MSKLIVKYKTATVTTKILNRILKNPEECIMGRDNAKKKKNKNKIQLIIYNIEIPNTADPTAIRYLFVTCITSALYKTSIPSVTPNVRATA